MMPVTFRFEKGMTREQARSLLHRIGELPDVETFAEIEHDHVAGGEMAGIVVFERTGDSAEEDESASAEITRVLQRPPHTLDLEAKAGQ